MGFSQKDVLPNTHFSSPYDHGHRKWVKDATLDISSRRCSPKRTFPITESSQRDSLLCLLTHTAKFFHRSWSSQSTCWGLWQNCLGPKEFSTECVPKHTYMIIGGVTHSLTWSDTFPSTLEKDASAWIFLRGNCPQRTLRIGDSLTDSKWHFSFNYDHGICTTG